MDISVTFRTLAIALFFFRGGMGTTMGGGGRDKE